MRLQNFVSPLNQSEMYPAQFQLRLYYEQAQNERINLYRIAQSILLVLLVLMTAISANAQTYSADNPTSRTALWKLLENNDTELLKYSKNIDKFSALVFDVLANEEDLALTIQRGYWFMQSRWWQNINDITKAEILVLTAQNLEKSARYKEAISLYNLVLEKHIKALNQTPLAYALALIELSNCYAEYGQRTIVLNLIEKAIDVCHTYPNEVSLNDFITAYNNLLFYETNTKNLERFNQARAEVLDSLATNSRDKLFYLEIISRKYEVLNLVYQNKIVEALDALQKFAELPIENNDERQKKYTFLLSAYPNLITQLIHPLKNYELAGKVIENYIKLAIEKKFSWYHFHGLTLKASLLNKLGFYNEALKIVERSLAIFKPSVQGYSFYSTQVFRAQLYSKLNQYHMAEGILDSSMVLFVERFLDPTIELKNMHQQRFEEVNNATVLSFISMASNVYASIYKSNNKLETADKAEAFAQAASVQFTYNYALGEFDESLAQVHKRIAETFLTLLEERYTQNRKKQLEFLSRIEQNASQHLLKEFQNRWIAAHPKFKTFYIKEQVIQNNIEVLEHDLTLNFNEKNESQLKLLKDSLFEVRKNIRDQLGGFYELQRDFDFAKIQEKLRADDKLIKFHEAEEHLFRIEVSRKEIEVKCIGLHDSIKPKILEYAKLMRNPQTEYRGLSQELNKLLLPQTHLDNLIVVPEGYMNYLSFETLLDDHGKFLVEKHNFVYCPSIPFWYATKLYPKSEGKSNLICFTANYDQTPNLSPLKYAQEEVKEILTITSGKHIKSADIANFRTTIRDYKLAHLSMHAVLSDDENNPSELIFSNNEKLRFDDIYTTSLPLDMMVLSACNTGAGNIKNGEGIVSLSRALMLAGVKSNVVSMWSAPDLDTKEIMVEFYRILKAGQNKDYALAQAKRNYLEKNPIKSHPFFWGAFILNGDNSSLFPARNNWIWIIFGIGGIGVVVLVFTKCLIIKRSN